MKTMQVFSSQEISAAIGETPNPYEQAISIIGRTLSPFDEDNLISCFGFGDASTRDEHAFSFFADDHPCWGFEEVLSRYRDIVPHLNLSGPTSFAPVICASIDIVSRSKGQYHVLVIIADGQVTRNKDVPRGSLSREERATVEAIVEARFSMESIDSSAGNDTRHTLSTQSQNELQHQSSSWQSKSLVMIT